MAEKAVFSYMNDDLVASTDPVWIQWAFDMLISLFELVGLQTNAVKAVDMVFQPGPIAGRQSAAAYRRLMTVKGDPHR